MYESLCNVPRYNTASVESEPEWRTIYLSKAQSYIIQHCVGASPKEGTTSFTDLSIITPKDNCRKQLSFCCLIRLLLLRQYSMQSINATLVRSNMYITGKQLYFTEFFYISPSKTKSRPIAFLEDLIFLGFHQINNEPISYQIVLQPVNQKVFKTIGTNFYLVDMVIG